MEEFGEEHVGDSIHPSRTVYPLNKGFCSPEGSVLSRIHARVHPGDVLVRLRDRLSRIPPIPLLGAAAAFGVAVVAVAAWLALQPAWLGLRLAAAADGRGAVVEAARGPASEVPPGVVVTAFEGGGDRLELEPLDLVTEPDGMMGDYATYARFLARQDRLLEIQRSSVVRLETAGGETLRLEPGRAGRPWTDLPADFWVQVGVGLVAWVVSVAVFVFRSGETGARYLLLSGASTLLFTTAAAAYTTRELGFDGTLLRRASDLNFLGGSLFTASFVGLLLYYPRRIAPRWVGWAVVGLFAGWFALQQWGAFGSMTFARRFLVMTGVLATLVLAGVHWFGTRREPVARAALQWFLLSWLVGTSLFALLILLPQMFGVDTSDVQGYAFSLFLLVYGGLTFGILKFRLFEIGTWWRGVVGWTAALLVLVLLDLFFLAGLRLSSQASLSLSLLICGAVWLPLRGWLWRVMTRPGARGNDERFSQVLRIALQRAGDGDAGWEELLRDEFDPLRIGDEAEPPAEAGIRGHGRELVVPEVGGLPAKRLTHARGGRRLFSPADAKAAGQLVAMLRHAMESVDAYGRGVAEERSRIARDMHDNIMAHLLSALHRREADGKDEKIRGTIAELRDMIRNVPPEGLALDEALAGLRFELAERLEASGHRLEWAAGNLDGTSLSPVAVHALRSVLREAVSNVIRHAEADRVRVRAGLRGEELEVEVADNGRGFAPGMAGGGRGLENIRSRLAKLGGFSNISADADGTRLVMRLPLPASTRTHETSAHC